jgi:hypothetical protein
MATAPRYTRNTVILAKLEVTYGTDIVPTGTEAMLTSKPQLTPLSAQNVNRDVMRGFMGGAEQLPGSTYQQCSFDVELVNGGTAGTVPAWGCLLRACGFAELATVGTRVDYTPISDVFESASIYWYDAGLLHKVLGARGDVKFTKTSGGIPVMSFTFKGLYTAPTAATNATPTLTGFKTPQVVNEANTLDLTLGATHAPVVAPALTGGTAYPSLGIEWAPNNKVEYVPMLGGESVELTDRDASCTFQLQLTAAQEATMQATVLAATLTSVGLIHGTTAGLKSLIFLPFVQLINPTKVDVSGKRMTKYDGRVVPSVGNDEMRLVLF